VAVRCTFFQDGAAVDAGEDIGAARTRYADTPGYLWVHLSEPDAAEVAALGREYRLHRLALEDIGSAHQRPKRERYGEVIFLVVKTLGYDPAGPAVERGEFSFFLHPGFVLTVRRGPYRPEDAAHERLVESPSLAKRGPHAVFYAVIDRIVDDYERVAEAIGRDITDVEARVFSPTRERVTDRIYYLKREVVEARDAVTPLVPVSETLLRGGGNDLLPRVALPYLRDVADHLLRVATAVRSYDELLNSMLTAHLTKTSTIQNDDMRRISAWAAILAVPAVVSGIYGENFHHMPELSWTFGFPLSLLVILVGCVILYWVFHRQGWL
jgi:magnesium transporter